MAATRYGTRAHNAIGKKPSAILFLVIALALLAAAKHLGLF